MRGDERPLIDTSKPSPARIYDALLGGKDNFEADREAAAALIKANPLTPLLVRENRAFLARAVDWAARQRIRQYLDLGCGLPAAGVPSLHGTAIAVQPRALTAAVDLDAVAISHLRTRAGTGLTAIRADLRDPCAVLAAVQEQAGISLGGPVAVIFGLVLNFMDPVKARDVVRGYMAACAPGSILIASAGCACDAVTGERVEDAYKAARVWSHGVEEFRSFFGGLEVVAPGICDARSWRPGWSDAAAKARPATVLAGAGRLALSIPLKRRRPHARHPGACARIAVSPGSSQMVPPCTGSADVTITVTDCPAARCPLYADRLRPGLHVAVQSTGAPCAVRVSWPVPPARMTGWAVTGPVAGGDADGVADGDGGRLGGSVVMTGTGVTAREWCRRDRRRCGASVTRAADAGAAADGTTATGASVMCCGAVA